MNTFPYRILLRVVLEATTALAVGSGEKDITTDALVATDANGLPYLPGTTIAGVLRHTLAAALDVESIDQVFGHREQGARLIASMCALGIEVQQNSRESLINRWSMPARVFVPNSNC